MVMKVNHTHRLFFSITGTLLLWASAFPVIKIALQGYTPTDIALLRFSVASLIFSVVAIYKKIALPKLKDFPLLILMAIFGGFAYHLLLNHGELLTDSGTAGFIINTAPIFTIFTSYWLFNESITPRKLIGAGISLFGIYLIARFNHTHWVLNLGMIYLCFASLSWSLFFVVQKILLRNYSPIDITCFSTWIATLLFLLISNPIALIHDISHGTLRDLCSVIYLGVFSTSVAYWLWSYTLSKIDASVASIYTYLMPFITALLSYFMLGERYSDWFLVGAFLMIMGIVIADLHITRSISQFLKMRLNRSYR
jgi:drug/metabolite transporter (DMT)-like permease